MPALLANLDIPSLLLSSSASLPSPFPTTTAPTLSFVARQNSNPAGTPVIIPSTYGSLNDSPSPGVVVGIVLGSVAGFLVLLFLIYSALGFGPAVLGAGWGTRTVEVSGMAASRSVLSFRSRPEHGKHHRHSRRGGDHATEMFEVRTRERVVQEGGQQAPPIIVEPTRQPPPPTFVPPPPRVVRDDDEDEVVVIEEHSPPPRRKSRRHSSRSRRSDERRRSYRDVDPPREARRESSRRYSSRDYSREP